MTVNCPGDALGKEAGGAAGGGAQGEVLVPSLAPGGGGGEPCPAFLVTSWRVQVLTEEGSKMAVQGPHGAEHGAALDSFLMFEVQLCDLQLVQSSILTSVTTVSSPRTS